MCSRLPHFEPSGVIHSMGQRLLGSKIALGGLDRCMPEQELYLFEFTASFPAELRTSPSRIVRRQLSKV